MKTKIYFSAFFLSLFITCSVMSFAQVKKTTTKSATKTTVTKKAVQPTQRISVKRTTRSVVSIKDNSVRVKISTDSGIMIVKLYDSTPLHRDNFVKLVQQGFYDSLMFHRIIQGFMIQGGDPNSKNATPDMMLGNGGSDMARIPAEFRPSLFHKRGALAAARDNNPEKASSACQFYIAQGKTYTDAELDNMQIGMGRKFTPAEREAYKTVGGIPFLDQNYTVFGEVISGFDVIDKIAAAAKNGNDRPLTDIRMKMEIVK